MEVKEWRSKFNKICDRLTQMQRFNVSMILFNVLTLNISLTNHFAFLLRHLVCHFPNGDCWLLPYIRFPFTLNSHFIQIIELCVYLCTAERFFYLHRPHCCKFFIIRLLAYLLLPGWPSHSFSSSLHLSAKTHWALIKYVHSHSVWVVIGGQFNSIERSRTFTSYRKNA